MVELLVKPRPEVASYLLHSSKYFNDPLVTFDQITEINHSKCSIFHKYERQQNLFRLSHQLSERNEIRHKGLCSHKSAKGSEIANNPSQ